MEPVKRSKKTNSGSQQNGCPRQLLQLGWHIRSQQKNRNPWFPPVGQTDPRFSPAPPFTRYHQEGPFFNYKINTKTQTPLLLQPKLTALHPFKANHIGLESEELDNISTVVILPYQE